MNESSVFYDLAMETGAILISVGSVLEYLFGYIAIILVSLFIWRLVRKTVSRGNNFNTLKILKTLNILMTDKACAPGNKTLMYVGTTDNKSTTP